MSATALKLATAVLIAGAIGCADSADDGKPSVVAEYIYLPSVLGLDDYNVFVGTGCLCRDPGGESPELLRIPIDGGEPTPIPMQIAGGAYDMVLDAERVYWSGSDGALEWTTKDGTATDVIYATTFSAARALAIDDVNLYWADFGGFIERISKADLLREGGQAAVFSERLGSGSEPMDIVVDATNVYFADRGTDGMDGVIWHVPIAGGQQVPLVEHVDGLAHLAIDDEYVYFSVHGSEIRRVPKNGGTPMIVAEGLDGTFDLVVDQGDLYFGSASGLRRVAVDGGSVEVLHDASEAYSIVVGAERVFWIARDFSTDLLSLSK